MKIASIFWQVLRGVKQNFLPVLLGLTLLAAAANAENAAQGASSNEISTTNNFRPSATFQRMWIDYNVTEGGQKGMRIHTAFKVYDMKGMSGYLALYFQYRNGTPLKDKNGAFNSTDNTVAAYREITPAYNPAVYEDYDIFMPYDELDLPAGEYDLQIDAKVIYKQGGSIGDLTVYPFEYSNKTNTNTTSGASGTLNETWVDYNVTRNGRRGMLVHIDCNVLNMRGRSGYLAFYFQKKDNTRLYTSNPTYRSNEREGQIALYVAITPAYDNARYDDETVFLPYEVFNLPRGGHDLTIDIDLIEKNGTLIQHLGFHDFWYERK